MILLLDIGNSRVKWAWLRDGQWQEGAAAVHRDAQLDELWQLCWGGEAAPLRVVAAVVAPAAVAASLGDWVRRHWGVALEQVHSSASAAGVVNGYSAPTQLGVDRWCALVAARALEPGLACVVDCGTAVTIDLLLANGEHGGGWIGPGLDLMRGQLLRGTSGVRFSADEAAAASGHEFARSTADAVMAGTGQMLAGMVMQALTLAEQRYGLWPQCILTGGNAADLMPLLSADVRHEPDLVLRGVAVLARDSR